MAFNVGDDAGYAVLFVPFLLYYCLTTTTTNNVYELPYSFNNDIMNSDGTYGWNGGNSSDMSFSNDFFKSVGDNKLVKLIAGNTIKVNLMPGFDPSSEAKSQTITINIELINDSEEAAVNNFLMCHTLFGNNRWLQYGFVQTGASLYDIKLPGANRYFMCSGSFSCKGKGVFRTPSDAVIKEILNHTATTYNAKTIYGKKGKNGLTLRENLIKSNVELRTQKLLPPTNKDDNGNNSSGNTSNGNNSSGTTEGNTSGVTKRTLINRGGLGGTQSPWWGDNKKPSTSTPSKPSDENTPEIEPIKPSTSIIITESDYKKHCDQTFVSINNNANNINLNSISFKNPFYDYIKEDAETWKWSLNNYNKKNDNLSSSNVIKYFQEQVSKASVEVYNAKLKCEKLKNNKEEKEREFEKKRIQFIDTEKGYNLFDKLNRNGSNLNNDELSSIDNTLSDLSKKYSNDSELSGLNRLVDNNYYKYLKASRQYELNNDKDNKDNKDKAENSFKGTDNSLMDEFAIASYQENIIIFKQNDIKLDNDSLNKKKKEYEETISVYERLEARLNSNTFPEQERKELEKYLAEHKSEYETAKLFSKKIENFQKTSQKYPNQTSTIREFTEQSYNLSNAYTSSRNNVFNAQTEKDKAKNEYDASVEELSEKNAELELALNNKENAEKYLAEETAKVDEIINNIEVKEVNSDYLKSLIKIPDVYSLTLTFNSLIPDNFNNYIFGFRAGNLDPLTNWNENSVRTGIYEEFANKLTEVLGKLNK